MRQGQQNRRGRGRNNNNNRKNQNPLSRSFESNGPDGKIRGTPAHIAEKYIALARDAQLSGDHVLAENYLQHAEHYSRIIMAYREQFAPQGESLNGHGARPQPAEGSGEDFGEEEGEDILDEGFQGAQPHMQQPQPQQQSQPQAQMPRQHGHDGNRYEGRGDRPYRRDQGRYRDRHDRGDRGDRNDRPMREDRGPARDERAAEHAAEPVEPRRPPRERFPQPAHEQPDFLRRPIRRPRSENTEAPAPAAAKEDTPRE